MHPEFDPVKAGEILNTPPRFESSSAVDGRIGNQLSQTTDIHSARDFFQTSGGQAKLPDISIDSGFGSETSLGNNSGFNGSDFSSWNATGVESATTQPGSLSQGLTPGLEQGLTPGQGFTPGLEQGLMPGLEQGLMPGLEQGALAGAMPPGGEPISPLVQMILKMPGLTGIVGDFFSALMAFFFPADGGLMALLDPTLWAAAAQNAFTTLATVVMHDFPMTLTTMGANNPFQTLLQQSLMDGGKAASAVGSPVTLSLEHQPFTAQTFDIGGNVGPGGSMYEMTSMDGNQLIHGNAMNVDWNSNKFLAMENQQGSFGPTISGSQVPTAQMQSAGGQVAPQQWQQQYTQMRPAQTGGESSMQSMQQNADSMQGSGVETDGRGSLLGNDSTTGSGTEIATTGDAQPHHLVQQGDNLWNIARDHLGSGQRWTEIYDLNKDAIGSNPDLIFSGTDLKLPGGAENIASNPSEYLVKPGDNLWNIAKDHLGGGKNWPSIYEQNAGTIGTNPDLIHPGQNLAIPDGGSHMQVAHAAPSTHTPAPTHSPTTNTVSNAHHPVSHAPKTAHHVADGPHAPAGDHLAHAKPSAPDSNHLAHAKPSALEATTHNTTTLPTEVATNPVAQNSAASEAAAAGAKTSQLGKATAITDTDNLSQGLTAVARSL